MSKILSWNFKIIECRSNAVSGRFICSSALFLAKEASKEVKVVLSGEGADEIFGGYNIYLEPKALRFLSWLSKRVRKWIASKAEII